MSESLICLIYLVCGAGLKLVDDINDCRRSSPAFDLLADFVGIFLITAVSVLASFAMTVDLPTFLIFGGIITNECVLPPPRRLIGINFRKHGKLDNASFRFAVWFIIAHFGVLNLIQWYQKGTFVIASLFSVRAAILFATITILAVLDRILHDIVSAAKLTGWRKYVLKPLVLRPLLPIGLFGLAVHGLLEFKYFAAFILFEFGYKVVGFVFPLVFPQNISTPALKRPLLRRFVWQLDKSQISSVRWTFTGILFATAIYVISETAWTYIEKFGMTRLDRWVLIAFCYFLLLWFCFDYVNLIARRATQRFTSLDIVLDTTIMLIGYQMTHLSAGPDERLAYFYILAATLFLLCAVKYFVLYLTSDDAANSQRLITDYATDLGIAWILFSMVGAFLISNKPIGYCPASSYLACILFAVIIGITRKYPTPGMIGFNVIGGQGVAKRFRVPRRTAESKAPKR